ncbi:transposase [Vibrio harveyi]
MEGVHRRNTDVLGTNCWSLSYFAGSCGGASLEVLTRYIESQNRPD